MAVAPNKINVQVKKRDKVFVNQARTVVTRIGDLADVDTSAKTDGSVLIYDVAQSKFVSSTLLEKQDINGGHY